jgi:hypothetical protein
MFVAAPTLMGASLPGAPACAADLPIDQPITLTADMRAGTDTGQTGASMAEHGDHATTPAGVYGAAMIGAGKIMLNYTPMFMGMSGNYIGSSTVSPQTIATTVPSQMTMGSGMMAMPEMYRVVPTSMEVQAHMVHAMVGVTDWLDLMVMGSYLHKSMTMTTFAGASGTTVLGSSTASTSGFGDTAVMSLVRLYDDGTNHLHGNLGLSLPSGSTTETVTMLSPMNKYMTMRASYGMQLGTGTVDLMPGLTYTGHVSRWSWGAAWRGRFPLDENAQGYRYGDFNLLTGWGGYMWIPGLTTTARIAGTSQDRIHGADPMISGLMPATNPDFYGGRTIDILGGIELAGAAFGLGNTHLALEGGAPVYQDLNGPQLGRAWEVSLSAGIGF